MYFQNSYPKFREKGKFITMKETNKRDGEQERESKKDRKKEIKEIFMCVKKVMKFNKEGRCCIFSISNKSRKRKRRRRGLKRKHIGCVSSDDQNAFVPIGCVNSVNT